MNTAQLTSTLAVFPTSSLPRLDGEGLTVHGRKVPAVHTVRCSLVSVRYTGTVNTYTYAYELKMKANK